MSRKQRSGLGVAIVAVSFLMALLAGAIMLVFQGQNPAEVYYYLLAEPLSSPGNLVKVLGKATPLIFAGLASALAFRCNVFNIGVEGQLYLGGLTAAYLGCALTGLPHWLHILICIAGAMIAGNHPIGVLITALLLGLMSYGGVNINIMTSVPTEWVNVLTGLVFAFVVIGNTVLGRWKISLPALGRRKKEGTA